MSSYHDLKKRLFYFCLNIFVKNHLNTCITLELLYSTFSRFLFPQHSVSYYLMFITGLINHTTISEIKFSGEITWGLISERRENNFSKNIKLYQLNILKNEVYGKPVSQTTDFSYAERSLPSVLWILVTWKHSVPGSSTGWSG